jgi:hypothetical protein
MGKGEDEWRDSRILPVTDNILASCAELNLPLSIHYISLLKVHSKINMRKYLPFSNASITPVALC